MLKHKEREKQAALLDATIEAQEGERARIGSNIHDEIGPNLSIIRLHLDRLKRIEDTEKRNAHIDLLSKDLDSIINEVRRVAKDLIPVVLIEFGLEAALENLCQRISKIEGISASLVLQKEIPNLSTKKELAIYRICQEFCNNTVKYANAKSILIALSGDPLSVIIEDDGKGFDAIAVQSDPQASGIGLKSMSARAQAINAQFELVSSASGTRAELKLST